MNKAICIDCLTERNLTKGNLGHKCNCGSKKIVWVFSTVEEVRKKIIEAKEELKRI